ncbi:MAG: chemotaxis-specific protein-glutamate methyltransferase CheB [Erythrobacter sp.]
MRESRTTLDQIDRARGGTIKPIRVMVVDDSLTVRTVFSRMVESDPGLIVSSTANNAEQAIDLLKKTEVDVILLDLEMPGMGGLEALPKILTTAKGAQALVVSSLTQDGAEHTLAALSMGAAETMQKPRSGGFDDSYRASLLDKIRALGGLDPDMPKPSWQKAAPKALARAKRPEVIAIGASTGGIHALNIVLRALPQDFALPILVTQHLPASFMPVFARQVEVASARRTSIAEEGTRIRRGEILIASGEGHMEVQRNGEHLQTTLSRKPARTGCLPSVDPMLESLSTACKGNVLAVILSGMGTDGMSGAKCVVESGGTVLAQNAETSAVWGMPGAVAKADLASAILPPEELATEILNLAGAAAWK